MGPKKNHLFHGEAKNYLACNFTMPTHLNIECRNGHILNIFISNNESFKKTVEIVNKLFNCKICKSQIVQLVNRSKFYARNFSRDSKQFINICNMLFAYQKSISAMPQSLHSTTNSSNIVSCSILTSQHNSVLSVSNINHLFPSLSGPTFITSSHKPIQPRLRADQLSPRKKVLRKRLTVLANEMERKKQKHKEDLKEFKKKAKARPYQFKYLNQVIACKETTILHLRKNLKEKYLNLELKKLQNHIFFLKQQLTSTQSDLSYQKAMLSQQLADKNSKNLLLQNNILILQKKVEQMQQITQNTKNEKCYSADIRALIYDMLVCQLCSVKLENTLAISLVTFCIAQLWNK
ncbi:uncharacterized protein LOC136083789 [Hydra vulgaris]|uniref:uncharacterized protein LOC136083789 n=1 Tax=Hydra vulgaris TaxID=6087 RepID=UPI0032EA5271